MIYTYIKRQERVKYQFAKTHDFRLIFFGFSIDLRETHGQTHAGITGAFSHLI